MDNHTYWECVPAYNQILFHIGYIDDNMSETRRCLYNTANSIFEQRSFLRLELNRQLILRRGNKNYSKNINKINDFDFSVAFLEYKERTEHPIKDLILIPLD